MVQISGSTWNKWLKKSNDKKKRERNKKAREKKRRKQRENKLRDIVKRDQKRSKETQKSKQSSSGSFGEALNNLSAKAWSKTDNTEKAAKRLEKKERERKERERQQKQQQQKKKKGGFWSDPLGAKEWSRSEDAEKLREKKREQSRERREAKGHWGRLKADLGKFDTNVRAGLDFALDNPRGSVQDTSRGVLREAYSAGAGRDVTDKELVGAYADAAGDVKRAWDDSTPDSTALKAGGWLTEALIADPAKAAATGLTGVDIDERTSEGTVGAADAFDIGVTVGTAGLGSAATKGLSAAAKSDEAAGLLTRLLGRNADEVTRTATSAARTTDETTDAFRLSQQSVDDAVRAVEEGDDLLPAVYRGADETAAAAEDVAGLADETTRAATSAGETVSRTSLGGNTGKKVGDWFARNFGTKTDDAAKLADEGAGLTDDAAKLTDEGVNLSDEGLKLTDEGLKLTDEAVQVGDEAPGFLKRTLTSSSVKVATGVGGGIVGGGLLYDYLKSNNQITVTDPETGEVYVLTKTDSLMPTETHTEGGSIWEVALQTTETTTDPETGESRTVSTGLNPQGYTVVLGATGKNVWILGSGGERKRSRATAETWNAAISARRGGS